MATSKELLEHIIDLKETQSRTTTELTYLRTELKEHREESKQTRKEIEQAKGSIKTIKWVISSSVIGAIVYLWRLFIVVS